jgi:hypothetical protein
MASAEPARRQHREEKECDRKGLANRQRVAHM